MSNIHSPPPDSATHLLQLEAELFRSDSLESFSFVLVNQLRRLLPYQQATLWVARSGGMRLMRGSGVEAPDQDAPYLQWLARVANHITKSHPERPTVVGRSLFPPKIVQEWDQHSSGDMLAIPLWSVERKIVGLLLLVRPSPWREEEQLVVERFAEAAAVVMGLHLRKQQWRTRVKEWGQGGWLKRSIWVALLASLFVIPVRLSALAPAEIVAANPFTITAPMEGVVESILVEPNQQVEEGQLLLQLDEKGLKSQLQIEIEGAQVAEAELLRASQKAFEDHSGDQVRALRSRLRQHQARVEWVRQQIQQVDIRAPISGVVVDAETHGWKGRPVRTGEKILTLANPRQIEVEMWLPVEDLLPINHSEMIDLYLYRHGNQKSHVRLKRIGYQPEQSPQGVLSYRVIATVERDAAKYRIGERGSARVYGPERSLFFYLFRKPIFWIRSWMG